MMLNFPCKGIDRNACLWSNSYVGAATLISKTSKVLALWVKSQRGSVRAKNPRGFLLCGVKTEVSLTKEATQKAIHRTRLITGGLNSVNSVSIKQRYWWERVCNTAQMVGEDSDHDPNGCRVAMSAMGIA